MIKKKPLKKTKSLIFLFFSSFLLVSCSEDKPKWYDKYLDKANSVFSDYETYSKYKPSIEEFLKEVISDPSLSNWNFKNYTDLISEFTFDNKNDFKNCKISLNYLFPSSALEPKDDVKIEGYFLVPNDNKKKDQNQEVEKNFYLPVEFQISKDLSDLKINYPKPWPDLKDIPYNFFYWKNIDDEFFTKFINLVKSLQPDFLDKFFNSDNFSQKDIGIFDELKKDFIPDINDLKIKNFKFTSSDDTFNLNKSLPNVSLNSLILWNQKIIDDKKIPNKYNISINFNFPTNFNFKDAIDNDKIDDHVSIQFIKI